MITGAPEAGRGLREPLDGLPADPLDAVHALAGAAGERRLTALAGDWGEGTIVAADPVEVVEAWSPEEVTGALARLDARVHGPGGTWVVLLGHEAGAGLDSAWPRTRGAGPPRPLAVLTRHDHLLRNDGRRWWAEGRTPAALDRAFALAAEATGPSAPARGSTASDLRPPDGGAHMRAVERAVTAIRTGEVVQTTICSRWQFHVPEPVAAWVRLVRALRPGHAALVTGPWGALVGASPELYLRRSGHTVESRPVKGTAAAGTDPGRLRGRAKDAAENIMIVDLVRNDLSRVCEPGTVAVPEVLVPVGGSGVLHLVSRVTGRLRAGVGDAALVAATFPPGSVTGAPKLRATALSAALEPVARGAHTGAVGIATAGGIELAVTIRSIEVDAEGRAELGVGSGVTVESVPAAEWRECRVKAAPLLAALGLPVAGEPAAPPPPGDPGLGLIETALAVDGRVVELADHAARLRRSHEELYGRPPAPDPAAVLAAAAPPRGTYRVRLRARPGRGSPGGLGEAAAHAGGGRSPVGDSLEPDAVTPCPAPVPLDGRDGLRVAVVAAPRGGGGPHKLADRAWWEAAEAAAGLGGRCDAVVVADGRGHLLEGSRASLVASVRGRLLLPPLDGRILPGTARQQLVDEAVAARVGVDLGPLDTGALARTDGLLLVNAVTGARWVCAVRGAGHARDWGAPDALSRQVAGLLLGRWARSLPSSPPEWQAVVESSSGRATTDPRPPGGHA